MFRTKTFHVTTFDTEEFTAPEEEKYINRDTHHQSPRRERATIAAALVLRDKFTLHKSVPNLKHVLLDAHFLQNTVDGIGSPLALSSLQYDSKWLGDSSTLLKKMWCSLHKTLVTATNDTHVFDVMIWLSTMAFADSADMNVIQALAALYRDSRFSTIPVPTAPTFKLAVGKDWNYQEVQSIVQCNLLLFDDSAESNLPKQDLETEQQHIGRTKSLFNNAQNAAVQSFMLALQQQWPTRRPSTPTSATIDKYIRVTAAMKAVTIKYEDWYDNREFSLYLDQVSRQCAQQANLPVVQPRHILLTSIKQEALSYRLRQLTSEEVFATAPPCIAPQCK